MNLDGLSALIINSDLGGRSRLREVLKSCIYKAELKLMQSLREAKENIELLSKIDIVLLSFDVGEANISEFIKFSKESLQEKCPTFVVTISKQKSNTSSKVTNLYMDGIAGFIAEPFSPEELTVLLSLVKEKNKLDETAKNIKALRFLAQEASKRIDDAHKLLVTTDGKSIGAIIKELKIISASLKPIFEQNRDEYIRVVSSVFESSAVPTIFSTAKRAQTRKKQIIHPGRFVSQLMKERSLTLERLTPSIKMDIKEFELFLNEKRPLDEELSKELSRLFGKTSKEWEKMQKEYDLVMEQLQKTQDTK